MKITGKHKIGEVLEKYPHLAGILIESGLHCVGCAARFSETLEDGLRNHGMDDRKISEIIKKLNENIDNAPEGISVSEQAAKKLKEILRQEGREDYGLRICVKMNASGCRFGLDFEKSPKESDRVIKQKGIRFFVAKKHTALVNGAKIDYREGNFHISR